MARYEILGPPQHTSCPTEGSWIHHRCFFNLLKITTVTKMFVLTVDAGTGEAVPDDGGPGCLPAPVHDAAEERQRKRLGHRHDGRPHVQEKRVRPGHVSLPAASGAKTRWTIGLVATPRQIWVSHCWSNSCALCAITRGNVFSQVQRRVTVSDIYPTRRVLLWHPDTSERFHFQTTTRPWHDWWIWWEEPVNWTKCPSSSTWLKARQLELHWTLASTTARVCTNGTYRCRKVATCSHWQGKPPEPTRSLLWAVMPQTRFVFHTWRVEWKCQSQEVEWSNCHFQRQQYRKEKGGEVLLSFIIVPCSMDFIMSCCVQVRGKSQPGAQVSEHGTQGRGLGRRGLLHHDWNLSQPGQRNYRRRSLWIRRSRLGVSGVEKTPFPLFSDRHDAVCDRHVQSLTTGSTTILHTRWKACVDLWRERGPKKVIQMWSKKGKKESACFISASSCKTGEILLGRFWMFCITVCSSSDKADSEQAAIRTAEKLLRVRNFALVICLLPLHSLERYDFVLWSRKRNISFPLPGCETKAWRYEIPSVREHDTGFNKAQT